MFLAATAFAIAFAAFSYLGISGIVVSAVTGMCVGLICLIVKPNQIWPMIRTGLTTIFGGFVGLMLYPMILGNSSGNDALGVIGMGGLIGFAIGCSMTASQCQKRETMQQDKSKNESATLSEELNEHHVPLVYPRWLKGFGIQLVAYISVLLIGFFAGFRHLNEESSVTATIALATAIGFAVTLVGSIIFCLATIVTSRELKFTSKLMAVLCSLVLFLSVFAVFYLIAMAMFVPVGMYID